MLFSILETKIKCNDVVGAEYYMNELNELKVSVVDNMYMQTMMKFFAFVLGLIQGDTSKCNDILQIIDIFSFLDLPSKSKQCSEFLEEIIRNYNILVTDGVSKKAKAI